MAIFLWFRRSVPVTLFKSAAAASVMSLETANGLDMTKVFKNLMRRRSYAVSLFA